MAALGIAIPGLAIGRGDRRRSWSARRASGGGCGVAATPLVSAYGDEVAELVALASAPELRYEEGMHSLPVDFRSCRQDACANGPRSGPVDRSFEGEPVTAFTHVVDCRGDRARSRLRLLGRSGRLGLRAVLPLLAGQRDVEGAARRRGSHDDDWEASRCGSHPTGPTPAPARTTATTTAAGRRTGSPTPASPIASRVGQGPRHLLHLRRQPRRPRRRRRRPRRALDAWRRINLVPIESLERRRPWRRSSRSPRPGARSVCGPGG